MLKKEQYNFLCTTSSSPEGYGLGFPKGVVVPKIIPHEGARCELPEGERANFSGPIEYVPLKPGKSIIGASEWGQYLLEPTGPMFLFTQSIRLDWNLLLKMNGMAIMV